MKPFNLDKALAGEPVVTRDGQKIIEIHYFKYVKTKFPLVVHIENNSSVDHYTINGKWTEDFENENLDLFMAEPETWINVFYNPTQDIVWLGVNRYKTEEEAQENLTDHKWYQTSIKLKL